MNTCIACVQNEIEFGISCSSPSYQTGVYCSFRKCIVLSYVRNSSRSRTHTFTIYYPDNSQFSKSFTVAFSTTDVVRVRQILHSACSTRILCIEQQRKSIFLSYDSETNVETTTILVLRVIFLVRGQFFSEGNE